MFAGVYEFVDAQKHGVDQVLEWIGAAYGTRGTTRRALTSTKGLLHVQIYAMYEQALARSFSSCVQVINQHALQHDRANVGLRLLALHAKINSVRDCSPLKMWRKGLDLLRTALGADAMLLSDIFPGDDSKMEIGQVEIIWSLLGVTAPLVPGHLPGIAKRISEVVELRNGIAHGRIEPHEVGRQKTVAEISGTAREMYEFCYHVIQNLAQHVASESNLYS